MNKYIRWYNQNRGFVITAVIVVALLIIIIHTLNGILEKQNEEKRKQLSDTNSSTSNSTTISEGNVSAITGEKVPDGKAKVNTDIIKNFVQYCNDGKIEEAYNMLTNECKEILYPTLDTFKTGYCDKIFYMYRMYNLENWYSTTDFSTYYITYTEDVLATGNVNSSDNREDYITIAKTQNGYKLNLNSYVGRDIRNKSVTKNNIELKINYADMYMDYTILNFSVKNNTLNPICIDTKENINTMYLYDSNGVKYTSFLNEIADEQLVVYREMTNTINVKFNKIYNPERTVKGIKLNDVVLNYVNYKEALEEKQIIDIDTKI